MKWHRPAMRRIFISVFSLLFVVLPGSVVAEPSRQAVSAFNVYVASVEARLARQHSSQNSFLASVASSAQGNAELRNGKLIIEQLTPANGANLRGAMLHDWRGTAFVAGAKAADFEKLMRNFDAYPQVFSPQVLRTSVLAHQGDHYQVRMRVKQRHVITVVMDATYDVTFHRVDAQRGYSISRSTQISEIDSPGAPNERALKPGEDHGFLWRSNTYWTYEERDGGLYMQVESISLTRSIPTGLGWVVRPFVQSVPRDSLDFTLQSVCSRLRK